MHGRARFLATIADHQAVSVPTLAAITASTTLVGGLVLLLPPALASSLAPIAGAAAVLAYVVFFVLTLRRRKVPIDLLDGRVVVDDGKGGVFPCDGALVGQWIEAGIDIVVGAAIRVSDGSRGYSIGGRGHAAPVPVATVVTEVDATLEAADFAALVASVEGIKRARALRRAP